MKLSIIICLYNTKKELFEKCLGSIYTSTLKDFEVVVIDDGSEEKYDEIIEKYNPVYVKTPNRGQLAARLYGIMLANGEYVAYVDSDDTVSFNYHEPMVKHAINNQCDIVINDWAFRTSTTSAYSETDRTIAEDISVSDDEILRFFASSCGRQHSAFVLWNKIFKKELLLKAKEEIEKTDAIMKRQTYSEDMLITFFASKSAKKLENIHTGYYFYCLHSQQSINVTSKQSLLNQIDTVVKNILIMKTSVGENKYKSEILSCLEEWNKMMSRTHYSYAKAQGYTDLFDHIKNAYGVERLQTSFAKDGADYVTTGLLGENFDGIDNILRWIYKKRRDVCVNYDLKDEYVSKSIEYLRTSERISIEYSKKGEIAIPKQKNSLKSKLLHTRLAYKVGNILFPKGSSARAKMKNKL